MEDAYKAKIRVRVQNLLGPKRHLDIGSCAFMKDLSSAMEDDFKARMQTMFRRREMQQAHRDHLMVEAEEFEKKSFFDRDSDEDWKENYSEESDEEEEKEELRRKAKEEVKLKIEEVEAEEPRKTEGVGDASPPIVELVEGETEEEKEFMSSEPESVSSEQTFASSEQESATVRSDTPDEPRTTETSGFLDDSYISSSSDGSSDEATSEAKKREAEGSKERESIFSFKEVFQKYQAPVIEDMQQEESVEKLFSLSKQIIAQDEPEVPTIIMDDIEGESKDDESKFENEDTGKSETTVQSRVENEEESKAENESKPENEAECE